MVVGILPHPSDSDMSHCSVNPFSEHGPRPLLRAIGLPPPFVLIPFVFVLVHILNLEAVQEKLPLSDRCRWDLFLFPSGSRLPPGLEPAFFRVEPCLSFAYVTTLYIYKRL